MTRTKISGQLTRQKEPTKEEPTMRRGIRIRMAKKRSNVRFNSIKMDLNFTPKSPIISCVKMIDEMKGLSKKYQNPLTGVLGRKPF